MKSDFVNPNVPNVQIKVRKRLNALHFIGYLVPPKQTI